MSAPWLVALLKATIPPLDRFLLKISRGYLNTGFQSVALVLTTGARSGKPREVPILCMPLDSDIVLVGSNWGKPGHPGWVHNLRADPRARVIYRGYRGPMLARELEGDERRATWEQLVLFNPQYAVYQDGVARRLPILRLSRVAAGPDG